MEIEKDACYDINNELDYTYSEIFTVGGELPSKVLLDNVNYYNQAKQAATAMSCVYYSTTHGSDEENYQEGSDVRIDPIDFAMKAKELGRLTYRGSLVSDGPKTAKELGYIKGWGLVKTLEEIKHSLINKRPIIVGSNQLDWKVSKKTPYVLKGPKGYAHCVCIIGYDDDYEGGCLIIKNSYGDHVYDKGKMYLKYTDIGLLFTSKYSLIDKEDIILNYNKKIMSDIKLESAKLANEMGLWNGERPQEGITREEAAAIIYRALQKIKSNQI